MPKILILYLAPHTYSDSYRYIQTNGCIQTCMSIDTDTFFTFWLINDIRHTCQRYKSYIWHATDIHLHMHRYSYVLSHQNTQTYNYYIKSTFKPKLTRIITLNRKFKEMLPCQINSETPTPIYDGVHDNILQEPLLPTHLHLVVNCQMSP